MKTLILLASLASAASIRAVDFVNLKFDEPDLSGPLTPILPNSSFSPLAGNTVQLLRGWSVTIGGVPQCPACVIASCP